MVTRHYFTLPLLLLFALPCQGDDLPWGKLPFEMKPLVQQGGENVAPPMGESLKGWEIRGDASLAEIEGKAAIRLGPKRGEEYARISTEAEAKPATLYSVSFKFLFSSDAEFDYDGSYPGLHGWVTARAEGGEAFSSWRIREQRMTTSWREHRTSFYTTRQGKRLNFSLAFQGVKGAAFISDVDIREERIAEDQRRQIILPPEPSPKQDSRFAPALMDYAEAPRREEPEPPARVTIFHRDDPDRLFFYSHPRPEEINKPIALALAPGEVGVTTLAVFTPGALSKLQPHIVMDGTFKGRIAWRVVQFHPRRVDYYGRGRTWRWVADCFLDRPDGIDSEPNRAQVFWIKVEADADAKAGSYTGTLLVKADAETVGHVPMTITVRPFRLAEVKDKVWGLYLDAGRWKKMSDEQALRELEDVKAHAISCTLAPVRGKPIFEGENVTAWEFDETDERPMGLMKKAGLGGPFIAWFGWLDSMLADRFNIPREKLSLPPDQRPEKLTRIYKECLIAFKKEFERRGWGEPVFHGVDEPGYWKKGSPEQFLWEHKAATEAGWRTYCTSSYLPGDPLGTMMTYHCYGGGRLLNPERTALILRETHAAGQEFWYYRTGAYSGEIGNVVRNRYYSGFMFFRSKADGSMSWTFQRPRGNAFDDFFAQQMGQACITYPDPEHPGENLDTPHWEGLRQGWIDYRYAATLVALGKESPKATRELEAVLDSMPWNGDVFMADEVTNKKCDEWREKVATLIEKHMRKD